MTPSSPLKRRHRRGLAMLPWLVIFALLGLGVFLFFLWLDDAVRGGTNAMGDQTVEPGQLIRQHRWQYRRQAQMETGTDPALGGTTAPGTAKTRSRPAGHLPTTDRAPVPGVPVPPAAPAGQQGPAGRPGP